MNKNELILNPRKVLNANQVRNQLVSDLETLSWAIENRKILQILKSYDELQKLDWENIADDLAYRYENLIDLGNEVLYS
jgi:hypothetical protein